MNTKDNNDVIIIRTSTIGHEINSKFGLLEWFLSQKKVVYGFKNAYFSGPTTLELSKIIYKQNKELLNDIKNYKKNINIIFKKYNDLGYIYNDDYTDDFNIYSKIENDLMSYYNDQYAYIDKSSINNCIYHINYDIDVIKKEHCINKYTLSDPTLPKAHGIKCPNANCPGKKHNIVYIKYL